MQASEFSSAVAAAKATAASVGLSVDDAIVLHDSNKLTLRLLPCDLVARVAPMADQIAQFEVDLAQQLVAAGCPVAALDPRVEPLVHERDGFTVTLWTYHAPRAAGEVSPADYADALERLHAGMRTVVASTPHFTQRVESAQRLVSSHDLTPALPEADRQLLSETLSRLGREIDQAGGAQLLHGEPHPGNLLATEDGMFFIDLETCCRGPVEFDLAHAPDDVADHYRGVNRQLLRSCRILVLAMITAWRWDKDDEFPDGRRLGAEWMSQLRAALADSGDVR